ncbi:MAG: hypothetical protein SXQ77_03235 [Halobacteria archaeon]|nr:hypothetical protein [Halobacteria archaeon]
MSQTERNWNKGVYLVVGGVVVLAIAGITAKPSTPLAGVNDVASLLAIAGGASVIWGVVTLKRVKEEEMRKARHAGSDADADADNIKN